MTSSFEAMASQWPLDDEATAALVSLCLAEDVGPGDATNLALFNDSDFLTADLVAREDMVVAGLPFVTACFWALDPTCDIKLFASDGDRVTVGEPILSIIGKASALLTAERTALNMIQHLAGISTLTATYVDALQGTNTLLLDTRKTTPGLRHLEKYAVRLGGGTNHRMGLYDAIMLKDNHIAAAGSLSHAIKTVRAETSLPIQVECDTIDQVKEALKAGADSLLLDNMSLEELTTAVKLVDRKIPTEASGGVRLEKLAAIAATGVERISVGRITQSAPAIDIGMDYHAAS